MANTTESRYQVIKKVGHGGMANVYLAHDNILNRDVAIKLLNADASDKDSSALQRFLLEAHATTSLIHPNIVEVYDICDIQNKHFIVMEYVEGHTLKEIISLRGHIPPDEAVWIMKQLCSGIMEAHKNKIIHRDIKPQNVLVKNDGTCKIADFGIAVLNNSFELTSKDTVMGSVHYLAPELSKGENPTMQSDIYSLGIVFFELITGQVPYTGDSAVSIALKHFKEPLPDIRKYVPNVPQSIVNIITKATAKDVNERYENVALMLKDLNECLKPNHLHDDAVVLSKNKMDKYEDIVSKSVPNKAKYKKKKKFDIGIFSLILLSICSIAIVLFILMLTGIIKFGTNDDVEIPNIINMNINDANDFLMDYDISIDTANIKRELSDTVQENNIISIIPSVGTRVDKGSKITVVVSDGTFEELKNYIGEDIENAENDLLKTKINIIKNAVDNDSKPGTIISQNPEPGYKYDPNIPLTVTFEYVQDKSFTIDLSYKGRDINSVSEELKEKGANVEIVTKPKDEFESSIISTYGSNTVIYSEPSLGTIYSVDEGNVIKLYCYGE